MLRSGVQGKGEGWRFKFVNIDVWVASTDMTLERPRLSREEG